MNYFQKNPPFEIEQEELQTWTTYLAKGKKKQAKYDNIEKL